MMAELKIITMSDIVTEPVTFLWKPYIPRSKISIIQGDPGEGKTTMVLAVAAALTTGGTLPGGGMAEPVHVIFQTAEDGLGDTIKPRLERFGADVDRVHVIDESDDPLTLSDERIEQSIIEKNASLFILDPAQAYFGDADMHSAKGVRPLMKQLAGVAERTGCAIVIIGHLNKKGGKSQYRGLGSIDIFAAARSVMTVGRIDEDMRAVVHNKSNLTSPGASQAFGLDLAGGFCWLGDYAITIDQLLDPKKKDGNGAKPVSQLETAKLFIMAALSGGDVHAKAIINDGAKIGLSEATMKRAKSELGVGSDKRGSEWFWTRESDQGDQEDQGNSLIPLIPFPAESAVV
jgi:hypothetical protein